MSKVELERRMIGALLRIPFQYIVARIHGRLTESGFTDISPSHFVVFQHMRSDGIRSTELAKEAQMTKQSMGYLVDYLEEQGYVERILDPADGRARIVRLADRGWEVARLAYSVVEAIEAEWADYLGVEQMQQLRSILQELMTLVEEK